VSPPGDGSGAEAWRSFRPIGVRHDGSPWRAAWVASSRIGGP